MQAGWSLPAHAPGRHSIGPAQRRPAPRADAARVNYMYEFPLREFSFDFQTRGGSILRQTQISTGNMKTTKLLKIRKLTAIALPAFLALASASRAASVVGSKHDLKALTNSNGQVCIACHTPHNAQATQLIPLWNHTATATTFTLYSSPTTRAVMGQPTAATRACLSCHDGTVAIDSFGGKLPSGAPPLSASSNLGTSLSDDHPVSFTYDAALATATPNGKLISPSSLSWVDSAKTVPLFAGKLECASCHDAHDPAFGSFLRKSNAGSALCLSCHNQ